MSIAEGLTPKDTEEIKPGLFIQKTRHGYRQVNPMAWNGKIRWKAQLKTIFSFRTFFTIAIILFLAWSYFNDIRGLQEFYVNVTNNPVEFCNGVYQSLQQQNEFPTLDLQSNS